ncbi:MAG: Carboxy-terminal-processing protease [Parcubacteria group bacterium GW2011_GWC2_39_14]|nr:MAG: Carboxy-terminal-processing protease [Parcubacteria group bacterium GW2011_GWC2_39_14]KKR55539.1 MAG: Carboxy-terminal-processing protease [Parcubacteria group bacterium GW2011_GWA2_40_23]
MENQITNQTQNHSLHSDSGQAKKWKLRIIVGVIVIILLGIFFAGGYVLGKVTDGKITFKGDIELYKPTKLSNLFESKLLEQVWTIIQTDFVDKDKIDEKKLFYGAIAGFVSGLEDQHTVFLDPETTAEFEDAISGAFEGIGAEIAIKDGLLTIVSPLQGSPSERAGLLPGDIVFKVDGKDIFGLSVEKAARLIRGPRGTEVTLTIVRGDEDPLEIKIVRDVITTKSVEWQFRDDGLVHIKLKAFNGDTSELMKEFAKEVKAKNPKGIILDLRNDPGGLLDTALDVCSYWIENQVVLIEKFGDGRETKYQANNLAPFKNIPTVVLINQGSASGSEIVAGALQDYEISKLVGEKSYGKGSVQTLKKLPDGSSIKVTVAKWFTPKMRTINELGIAPDVEVDFTRADAEAKKDPQLDAAIKELQKK